VSIATPKSSKDRSNYSSAGHGCPNLMMLDETS
jgi:hypothetical protein